MRNALIDRFGECSEESKLSDRLVQLTARMAEEGFQLEVQESSNGTELPILTEHSCPYHELAAEDSSICDLEQSVFSELLGVPVELSACMLDGHQCCEFQVG